MGSGTDPAPIEADRKHQAEPSPPTRRRCGMAALIRAAGGVVWRRTAGGIEVCLVHRPRYDDWSLPKGKLEPGEPPLVAAVREVWEETGARATPQAQLPSVRYRLADQPKVVDYWSMRLREQTGWEPGSEVDDVAWLPAETATGMVRYRHDAELLRRWQALPAVTGVVLLLRHALAGARSAWPGPDQLRPLSPTGLADAAAITRLLVVFAPQTLVSGSPDRCRQTLAPAADVLDLPIRVDPVFDDATGDPAGATAALRTLATNHPTTVVCSQGQTVPQLLSRLAGGDPERWLTAKGDGWLIPFAGDRPLPPTPLRPASAT